MTLEDLRVFVSVCEGRSMSAVARELGRTQPAVSQHVRRLEEELGVPLLERRSDGVVPTAAGRALREAAVDGLHAIEDGVRQIADLRAGTAGRLSIATGGTTVRHFLRSAVVRFRKRHPDVSLEFIAASSTQRCLEALRLERADLALVTIGAPVTGLEQRIVARQSLWLIVPKSDRLAGRRRVRLRDLASIRYIGPSESTTSRTYIARELARQGIELECKMTVDDFDTASLFVELGLGHAIVPAVQARAFAKSGRVYAAPIEGLEPLPVGWATRRFSALSTVARAFDEVFRDELARMAVPGLEVVAQDA